MNLLSLPYAPSLRSHGELSRDRNGGGLEVEMVSRSYTSDWFPDAPIVETTERVAEATLLLINP